MKTVADLLRHVPEQKLLDALAQLHDEGRWPQQRDGYISALEDMRSASPMPSDLVCSVIWDIPQSEEDSFCNVDGRHPETGEMVALDFVPWAEWLSMPVQTEPARALTERPDVVLAEIVWEMTFHGFSYAEVKEVADQVNEQVEAIERAIEQLGGKEKLVGEMSPEEVAKAINDLVGLIEETPDTRVVGIFKDGEEIPLPKDTKH